MTIAEELSDFSYSLSFNDIPSEALKYVKYLLTDHIAVTARGAHTEIGKNSLKALLKVARNIDFGSVIIGRSEMVDPSYAILANGIAAHVLSFDDIHNEASLHPGAAVFPACMAATEMTNGDGKAFIEGVILGY